MSIRVAVVDDNSTIREGLEQIFAISPGFSLVCACATAEEAEKRIPNFPVDVVLMDINLPGNSGIECVRKLRLLIPGLLIIMLTIENDRQRVFESLAAGATGYLVKNVPAAKLLAAIEEVHHGGAPMSSDVARLLVQSFHSAPGPSEPKTPCQLSDRETEVLDLLAAGFRSREIGERLGISTHTVNCHVRHVYEKLHVRSRAEAVIKFHRSRDEQQRGPS